jgi:hypothetical protein
MTQSTGATKDSDTYDEADHARARGGNENSDEAPPLATSEDEQPARPSRDDPPARTMGEVASTGLLAQIDHFKSSDACVRTMVSDLSLGV